MNKIKEYFNKRTSEQIFSLCLLIGIVVLMLFCAIVRLCGGLWFTADLSKIQEPDRAWQEAIMISLLAFELTFAYKLLCCKSFEVCILIAFLQSISCTLLGYLTRNLYIGNLITNLFSCICIFVIPLIATRQWFVLIDSATLYILELIYSLLFLVGRIGTVDTDSAYNFVYSVLGTIDFKLFIVAVYLTINFFGGIRLWKKQKRLILQKELTKG